jgi:pseudaminic acid synthase
MLEGATMSKTIEINGRKISEQYTPYIIAEMSANHNGELNNAKSIITEAKQAGADAIKLQTYTPDTITLDSAGEDFKITEGLWAGKTLYELYSEAHLPFDWHKPLFDHARSIGISIFSTPFDSTAVDLLEDLGAPAYKIASFEAIDLPLIRYVAATKKPMIISTGMTNLEEIGEAVDAARSSGCKELALLKCVSSYPAQAEDYNLAAISLLKNKFNTLVGLSDHTLDTTAAISSVALGAVIIEKHFTLNRSGGGPDDSFSIEPIELLELRKVCDRAFLARGDEKIEPSQSELGNKRFRRSLYFCADLKSGDYITPAAVRSVRPGFGLPPKHLDKILGLAVNKDIPKFKPVSWDDIETRA